MELAQSTVMDGFFMHALLRRSKRYGQPLSLLHNCLQDQRFNSALEHYNRLMAGTGQPQYAHACHDCLKIFKDEQGNLSERVFLYPYTLLIFLNLGSIRAGTTDGVTLGHPCCEKTNCQIPLASMKDRFCPVHQHSVSECSVIHCEQPAEPNFLTCSTPTHRAEEEKMHKKKESAFDDLSRRLSKDNVPQTRSKRRGRRPGYLLADSGAVEELDLSSTNNTKKKGPHLRLRTTRKWTNNEQLFILACGTIVARSTFFSAEGVSSVAVSCCCRYAF